MGSKLHTDAATTVGEARRLEEDEGRRRRREGGGKGRGTDARMGEGRGQGIETRWGGRQNMCVRGERSARWHREARFFR